MLDRLTALFIAPTFISAQLPPTTGTQADLNQQISLIARPAVVRIVAGCSGTYSYNGFEYSLVAGEIGSGYFIDPNGYVATNYHVLRTSEETGCRRALFRQLVERVTGSDNFDNVSEGLKVSIRNSSELKDVEYVSQVVLPTGDSLPFEIEASGTPLDGDSEDVAIVKIGVTNAPVLKLAEPSSSEDSVLAIGYFAEQNPQQLLSSPVVLKSLSEGDSLGRADTLAGQLTSSEQMPADKGFGVQFEAALSPGITGSPVLNQNGEVVGMVTASSSNSGSTGSAIATSTIQKFVERAGAENQESQTNRMYLDGLEQLQSGEFEQAKATLEEVKELFPYHSEANWLISQSNQGIAQAQRRTKLILWFVCTGSVTLALLAAHFLLNSRGLRLMPRRRRKSYSSAPRGAKGNAAAQPGGSGGSSFYALKNHPVEGNPVQSSAQPAIAQPSEAANDNAAAQDDILLAAQQAAAISPAQPVAEAPASSPEATPADNRVAEPAPPVVPQPPEIIIKPVEPVPSATYKPAVTQIGSNGHNPSTIIGTQPFIELKNQDGQVRRLYLRKDRHQLGRDRDWADLWVPDNGWEVMSRHHAVLEKEGSDYRLYDGDRQNPSSNGIFLNGILITPQEGHLLKDGDELITGHDPRNQVILTYSNPGNSRFAKLQLKGNFYDQHDQS